MQLKTFKTLWGHQGTLSDAIEQACEQGFSGIEGQVPVTPREAQDFHKQLRAANLDYIAEITTAGSYVPDRQATLDEHLDGFSKQLELSLELEPLFVTCLGGCDAWSEQESIEFFSRAIDTAQSAGVEVAFETHRSRSFFNPWVTDRIVSALPELKLTCDYSHWCVVCERLMDTELEVLTRLSERAIHIHARVGYEQGPQVPHPNAPEYRYALKAHQAWWEMIWLSQLERGMENTTLTPEFGPDGYLHHMPFSKEPVADLWDLNCWMANTERSHYDSWCKAAKRE
jgi:sugar phosphate isomerase/epimerase